MFVPASVLSIYQSGGRFPIAGNTEGQVGWDSGQPETAEGTPDHYRGVRLGNLKRSFSTQTVLSSMVL